MNKIIYCVELDDLFLLDKETNFIQKLDNEYYYGLSVFNGMTFIDTEFLD